MIINKDLSFWRPRSARSPEISLTILGVPMTGLTRMTDTLGILTVLYQIGVLRILSIFWLNFEGPFFGFAEDDICQLPQFGDRFPKQSPIPLWFFINRYGFRWFFRESNELILAFLMDRIMSTGYTFLT